MDLKETIDFIYKQVEKKFSKDQRQYISKSEDAKFGIDLYLSTNELMNYIIKILRGNYHFILKRTKKLVGRDIQGGKNIYRQKALIKFLPMSKGDLVLVDEKEYTVDGINRNAVVLKDNGGTKTNKKYSFFFDKSVDIKKID